MRKKTRISFIIHFVHFLLLIRYHSSMTTYFVIHFCNTTYS